MSNFGYAFKQVKDYLQRALCAGEEPDSKHPASLRLMIEGYSLFLFFYKKKYEINHAIFFCEPDNIFC